MPLETSVSPHLDRLFRGTVLFPWFKGFESSASWLSNRRIEQPTTREQNEALCQPSRLLDRKRNFSFCRWLTDECWDTFEISKFRYKYQWHKIVNKFLMNFHQRFHRRSRIPSPRIVCKFRVINFLIISWRRFEYSSDCRVEEDYSAPPFRSPPISKANTPFVTERFGSWKRVPHSQPEKYRFPSRLWKGFRPGAQHQR